MHRGRPALADDAIKIAVVTHGQSSDTYWTVVKKGVDDAAKLMGVDVSYQAPQTTDMVAMSRMIDAAVAQKVNGLVVSIPDADALDKSVKAAVDAGIPVIVIDSGEDEVPKVGAKLFVGTTNYFQQGERAAKQLMAAGVTKGVCTNHEPGNLVNESACDGFIKGMNGGGDRVEISLDPTDTAGRIKAYLSAHPDVNGILALGAPSAANVVKALRDAGTLVEVQDRQLRRLHRHARAAQQERAAVLLRLPAIHDGLPADRDADAQRQIRAAADQQHLYRPERGDRGDVDQDPGGIAKHS